VVSAVSGFSENGDPFHKEITGEMETEIPHIEQDQIVLYAAAGGKGQPWRFFRRGARFQYNLARQKVGKHKL